ncbi:Ccne1 [Phodopus roborovskii]|uniref:Ccne1 protein n=1 Tax=Phodopus roborovskii TaxID=109678 RepID=A0AAV0A9M2_PHORO|nr:Ccne1 [Phodopus roborovskii]
MPRERKERDAKDHGSMKEEGGPDFSARSRKRKANVAVVSTKDTGWEGPPAPPPFCLTWVPNLGLPTY